MKSIVVFNNKGGVGKTTLLCNIASYLKIKKNKKVLVIDADPQCNATTYMFPYSDIEEIYKTENTIYKIIKPLQRGKGYLRSDLPIITSPNFKVDVIPGDTQLSLTEDFLSKDWLDGKAGDYRGLQTTLLFKDLLEKLQEDYDYVFFDVGPSLGALNRSVLAASDFYIVPMSSDIFSLQALENISKSLIEWKKQLDRGLEDYKMRELEDFKINNNPISWNLQFAGYITQQYTAKTVN
jgi:cellulose biosynthesis protein BcsQ